MKLFPSSAALLALFQTASSTECGKWYSSECACETDDKYCKDGENGASDDILAQHPFWKGYEGFYSYTAMTFMFGKYPALINDPTSLISPTLYGYMNHTIKGSRAYNHRYNIYGPNPNANCSLPELQLSVGECGVNGVTIITEGYGTSSQERDGSVVTTTKLQPTMGDDTGTSITDEGAEYKQLPIDENTLFGYAKSNTFLVTETFTFINKEKTEASAIQDVFMTVRNTTTLVISVRMSFKKMTDADSFTDAVLSKYDASVIPDSTRAQFPRSTLCSQETCPTEEDFCDIDPRCSATVLYVEPNASIKAGPIIGIVVAVFVVLNVIIVGSLYMLHKKKMKQQSDRNQAVFARRIAETIKLEGPNGELTPEAIAEEFKKIDNGDVDGSIDKKELWEFINNGKVGKMSESDFNALFAALDTDGDGTVSFMEFSAYMGQCQGDFNQVKANKSVKIARGQMMDDNDVEAAN